MTLIGKGLTLTLQRNLNSASGLVSQSLERLSSGQRLNRASDDASGRSIADSLNLKSRVYAQGVRNLSDGISALSIADSALGSLAEVATRLKELAVQAASGSLSLTQRRSLNGEGEQLIEEFNRVVSTAQFNGIKLLDGSVDEFRLQGGFGANGGIGVGIARELKRTVGDGSFAVNGFTNTLTASHNIQEADLNGDGNLDVVSAYGGGFQISFGKGDGSFGGLTSIATTELEFTLGDVNGDGHIDIIKGGTNQVTYYLNNGSGGFGAGQNLALSTGTITGVGVGDFNGDGINDIVGANFTTGTISVRLGTGGGSYAAAVDYSGGSNVRRLTIGDVNSDGTLDILAMGATGVNVFTGLGGGAFSTASFYSTGTGAVQAQVADFNSDGLMDIAVYNGSAGTLSILSGLSDGTFGAKVDTAVPSSAVYGVLRLGDFDGDGLPDLAVGAGLVGKMNVYRNQGDGSFSLYRSANVTGGSGGASIGDYNNDGVLDIGYAAYGSLFLTEAQGATEVSTIEYLNLANRYSAIDALDTIDAILQRISLERASVGASQSRLTVAHESYASSRLVSEQAAARISDADTATEVAALVRNQILQSTGANLLARANQSAGLVLDLLKF